jgi:flagellar basal-body rod modification protein FlgD
MSSTAAITSTTASNYTSGSTRVPIQTLGQDDFLKLLVTQMTSQDPMNPQKDTDFIAQMAQFSSLEQSKTMQSDIAALKAQQSVVQANSMIGATVTLQVNDTTTATGMVSSVSIDNGTPKLVVGGQTYGLDQVLSIAPTVLTTADTTGSTP